MVFKRRRWLLIQTPAVGARLCFLADALLAEPEPHQSLKAVFTVALLVKRRASFSSEAPSAVAAHPLLFFGAGRACCEASAAKAVVRGSIVDVVAAAPADAACILLFVTKVARPQGITSNRCRAVVGSNSVAVQADGVARWLATDVHVAALAQSACTSRSLP